MARGTLIGAGAGGGCKGDAGHYRELAGTKFRRIPADRIAGCPGDILAGQIYGNIGAEGCIAAAVRIGNSGDAIGFAFPVGLSLGGPRRISITHRVAVKLYIEGGSGCAVQGSLDNRVGAVPDCGGDDRKILPKVGPAVAVSGIVGRDIGSCTQIVVFSSCVQVDAELAVVVYLVLADKVAVVGQRHGAAAGIVDNHHGIASIGGDNILLNRRINTV